jgi:hypothetical protein
VSKAVAQFGKIPSATLGAPKRVPDTVLLDIDLRPLPKFPQAGLKRGASANVPGGLKLRQVIDYHRRLSI